LEFSAPEETISPAPPLSLESSFTQYGGLFFLIPAMQRAGLPEYLIDHPDLAPWNFPTLLLRHIARRLNAPAEDPAVLALLAPENEIPPEITRQVQAWTTQLRRWCRRTARIGLHSLVCRPGRIAFTETHIDPAFRASAADIRVRKAGLDIDPGWSPWFGRVVHFHYLTSDEFNA
jgi:hypothetical protein